MNAPAPDSRVHGSCPTRRSGTCRERQVALAAYHPSAYPQFSWDGSLLVSYSVNSDDSGDLIYGDAYRPKFIRLPIIGLLPNLR
jgi:hypothetical protein